MEPSLNPGRWWELADHRSAKQRSVSQHTAIVEIVRVSAVAREDARPITALLMVEIASTSHSPFQQQQSSRSSRSSAAPPTQRKYKYMDTCVGINTCSVPAHEQHGNGGSTSRVLAADHVLQPAHTNTTMGEVCREGSDGRVSSVVWVTFDERRSIRRPILRIAAVPVPSHGRDLPAALSHRITLRLE